jgi:uncharacterized membrane protein YkoI
MKDRTSNIGLLVGLLGLLATNCTTDTSGTEPTSAQDAAVRYERALQGASISLAEAIGIAQGAYPDGAVVGAEFELEEGVPAFEVEIALADGSSIEVRIDPESGDILSAEADDDDDHSGPGHDGADDHQDDDHSGSGDDGAGGAADDADDDHGNADCPSAVSRAEAIVAAEAATGAHAVEVEFEDCEFEVLVVKDGELQEVDVAADGTVLGVEAHDDDGAQDDDDGAQDDDHGAQDDDHGAQDDDHGDDDDAAGGSADVDDDHADTAGHAEEPDDDHSVPGDSAGPGDSDEPDDDDSGPEGDDGAGGEHP